MIYATKSGIHVRMGTGDVLVVSSRWSENPAQTMVSFHAPGRSGPIGAGADAADIGDAGPPAVTIEFTDARSIDSLMESLRRLREQFQVPTAAGPLPDDLLGEWVGGRS